VGKQRRAFIRTRTITIGGLLVGALVVGNASGSSAAGDQTAEAAEPAPLAAAVQLASLVPDHVQTLEVTYKDGRPSEAVVKSAEDIRADLLAQDQMDVTVYPDGSIALAPPSTPETKPREPIPGTEPNPDAEALAQKLLTGWRPSPEEIGVGAGDYDSFEAAAGLPAVAPAAAILPEEYRNTPTNFFSRNAIGHFHWTRPSGGSGKCTAWLYGHNILLTARHCVIDNNTGEWYTNLYWERGKDASSIIQTCSATNMYTYDVPVPAGPSYDLAAVRINCWIGGNYGAGIVAVLGQACAPGNGVYYPNLWITGYPFTHPNEQWEDYGSWVDFASGPAGDGWAQCSWLHHSMYQRGGMSGGPFTLGPCSPYGLGECAVGSVSAGAGLGGYLYTGHRFHPNEIPVLEAWRGY
jgi:hypothetical protein